MDTDALHKAALTATASGLTLVAASPLARLVGDVIRDWVRRRIDQSDKQKDGESRQLADLRDTLQQHAVKLGRIETKGDITHELVTEIRQLMHTIIAKR